jgi:glutamate synthase (NADPH/NADH) large chain
MKKQGLYLPEFEHENCGAGFICNLNGKRTNQIIHDALEILVKLAHRGGVSADGKTGDGAGLLIDIPHDYFTRICNFSIPDQREYAVGMVFLPKVLNQYYYCKTTFENEIKAQGLAVLGWREVPVESSQLGDIARASEPNIEQLFICKTAAIDEATFKAKLYAARKIAEHKIRKSKISESTYFYVSSLSLTTIIYKGIIMPEDIGLYYKDLQEIDLVTRLALVHQRFSTNTMPTWELAQPFRHMCQNGEINTLRGNISRMRIREEIMKSDVFGPQIEELFPIILPGKSDSASMDMVVELLTHTGRSLPEIMMMMIPEAWEKHTTMSKELKAFYEYNGYIMEPWDGPASVPFI